MASETYLGQTFHPRSSRLIPTAVGFVLLSAAVLKAIAAADHPSPQFASPRFTYLLVAFEFLLAV
jgi:hypothetical protein